MGCAHPENFLKFLYMDIVHGGAFHSLFLTSENIVTLHEPKKAIESVLIRNVYDIVLY